MPDINYTRAEIDRMRIQVGGQRKENPALRSCERHADDAAAMRAEAVSLKPGCAGAIAFSRTGYPATGDFGDAKLIRSFGDIPTI